MGCHGSSDSCDIITTDCMKPQNPTNGRFECESTSYKEFSNCYLVCDAGFIAATKISTACIFNQASGQYEWSIPMSTFQCVRACHLVLGGLTNKTKYDLP